MTSQTDTAKEKSAGKVVAAASIGNALEWYDFSIFAFFAAYIGHNFFLEGNHTSTLIKTYIVFGAGFIARPLGAVLLGLYGDRVGRKAALTMTIALMAIGTFIIAVAPTADVIGVGAAVLLLIGRLFQGFSAGGEIGGATAYLVESAPPKKRALYASCLQASMGFSNILAAVVGVVVTKSLGDAVVHDWGWRIPFIVGLLIVPVGFYIRNSLSESPEFAHETRESGQEKISLASVLKNYPKNLIYAFMLSILWTVCVYTLIIYMPTYYASEQMKLGFTHSQTFTAALFGNIFMVGGSIFAGMMADRIGARKMMTIGAVSLLAGVAPLLIWLHNMPTMATLITVQILFCFMAALFSGVAPVVLSSIFPVAVRSTGMSVSYNFAAIFFAGFTPALLTWATQYSVYAPAVWVGIASVVALMSLALMPKTVQHQIQN
ncbi:MFS transporter [Neisseria leonii]|uniref:MFS transporter n=1 Tax=Neisseria leonii TaxID=2995413 RepID=UPI00237A5FF8|nr:MFS transporter [Neisseria sp. 3986]MDD9325058.1 MFS transporter [Neisseria sp. 3986]